MTEHMRINHRAAGGKQVMHQWVDSTVWLILDMQTAQIAAIRTTKEAALSYIKAAAHNTIVNDLAILAVPAIVALAVGIEAR